MGLFTLESERQRIADEKVAAAANAAAVETQDVANKAAVAATVSKRDKQIAKLNAGIVALKAIDVQTPEIVGDIARLEADIAMLEAKA